MDGALRRKRFWACSEEFDLPEFAWLAPQAAGHTWVSVLVSFADRAKRTMARIGAAEGAAHHAAGRERGCAAGENRDDCGILARGLPGIRICGAQRGAIWRGLIAWTGGLIGPPGTEFRYAGSLEGTPAFLGAGDPDAHVPWHRVEESASVLRALGAEVVAKRYPGMPHTINRDELMEAKKLIAGVVQPVAGPRDRK